MKRIKITIALAAIMVLSAVFCYGCKTVMNDVLIDEKDKTVVITNPDEKKLEDNKLLYANDDDTSVVVMYLTVSKGNSSENTNHTWKEINTYSVYDYDEMGVERYAVNGLLQVGDENGPVEGEVGYGEFVPNATVTIRGQTSSKFKQKNYKIELKDGKGLYNDQRTINLNKHQRDGIRFRNKISFDILEEIDGMISMQTQFVHLYVKDETAENASEAAFVDYGLYTMVEQPNKSYLTRHGLDSNAHLYKINFFEFHRYPDVIVLKNDLNYDKKAFEEKIEIKGDDDHSKLIAMLEDVNDTAMPIKDVVDKWFETDNLFSWLAYQILMGNIDTQSRNVFLYSPQNMNTWYFISWDFDGDLAIYEDEIQGKSQEGSWEKGVSNYWGNKLFQRILKDDELRAMLDDKINEFLKILTPEMIAEKANAYAAVVRPYLYRYPDKGYAPLTESEFDSVVANLPYEIEKNYQNYLDSLENPMPFFIGRPQQTDTGFVLVWDNAYDFDAETVTYRLELSRNLEFTELVDEVRGTLLPVYEYKGTLEPGQYFVRVTATNGSGKSQTAFDYYVTDGSTKMYGVKCFYVLQDGTIVEDAYAE
ncbi:MAG: CotH kinase family protein [Lachnospiraceae bacterium]|nr:CotH kinase family protein [Lachnospiraceae bacterium]